MYVCTDSLEVCATQKLPFFPRVLRKTSPKLTKLRPIFAVALTTFRSSGAISAPTLPILKRAASHIALQLVGSRQESGTVFKLKGVVSNLEVV